MPATRTRYVAQALYRRTQHTRVSDPFNAFISRAPAQKAAPEAKSDFRGALCGQHIAIKDNICTTDLPTTCASNILREFRSPYDATVVRLLRDHGAVICGKTNMDEFGMGSHSINSIFGEVHNVVEDGEAVSAGGSSGGSAVAVATGQCWAAIGTDTGGSVRLPAAYNGVFGFKPSYGLISRWGVVAYANSLDTVGIIADSTAKIREIFNAASHYDRLDPTSLPESARRRIVEVHGRQKRRQLRIGVPLEYNIAEIDPVIRHGWVSALRNLESQGHKLVPVSLPSTQLALSAYYILAPAEASSNLAKYDSVRYGSRAEDLDVYRGVLYAKTRQNGFGAEVKRRILLGSYSLSSEAIENYFIKAQKIRRMIQREFDSVFAVQNVLKADHQDLSRGNVDVLLCPTAPNLPPALSELKNQTPVQSYMTDIFTVPASLAGLPAISIPYRPDDKIGVVGIQVIGQYGTDQAVLDVANTFEELGCVLSPVNNSFLLDNRPTKSNASSSSAKRWESADKAARSVGFSPELARSYFNMSRNYGGGMKAVQFYRQDRN